MVSIIGIKIANGEFYSLVEENSTTRKRLILTTVHDRQQSVQIDLYKSAAKSMADAIYIGSLVVENIKARPRGEPSIEMVITSSKNGNISAEAIDLDAGPNGEHQYLNVSLKSMDDDGREFDIPDFEMENNAAPPSGLYEKAMAVETKESRGFPAGAIIAAVAAALLILLLGVWFFVFRDRPADRTEQRPPVSSANETPAAEAQNGGREPPEESVPAPVVMPPVEETPPPPEPVEPRPVPVIEAPKEPPPAPAARARPPAPVSTYRVPSVIPREGAPYRIRWGDTLWDISAAFYRNPWLYPRIARFNNIRNPDHIISGRTIRIPPRN